MLRDFAMPYWKKIASKKCLCILLSVFLLETAYAQLSTKHYIPPITTSNVIGNQIIYITTPSTENVSFRIKPIGERPILGTVSRDNPYEHRVFFSTSNSPGENSQLHQPIQFIATVSSNKGYIIEANNLIYVSVRFRQAGRGENGGKHAAAFVSKGLAALGTTFRVGGMAREGLSISPDQLNFVSVMATENNTKVTFSDIPPTRLVNLPVGTTSFDISLNEGQSYILAISGNEQGDPNALISSLVTSDKPIVANVGSTGGTFSEAPQGDDYGVDQMIDGTRVGTEYIFMKGKGRIPLASDKYENALIFAQNNDVTEVYINGFVKPDATLGNGDYVVIDATGIGDIPLFTTGNGYNRNGNMYVRTSKPSFAFHGIGGDVRNGENQGFSFIPPLSCENVKSVNISSFNRIGNTIFQGSLNIITNVGATITINGTPINNYDFSGPFSVDGNTNYETYRVENLPDNVTAESTGELYCMHYASNESATFSSYYSGTLPPPEIKLETKVASAGNCIPNLTIKALNAELYSSIEWHYNDGSGFTGTGNASPSFKPTLPGDYKLVAISCAGNTFESRAIPVNTCPDDLDGDLVIDNLDIDKDNDGILNCDESLGNVQIDLSDLNKPNLTFSDGSMNNTFATTTITQTPLSTITGESDGSFTTSLDASNNNEVTYTVNFDQPVDIVFTDHNVAHRIVTGESFSISVGPSNKDITLIDPDNFLVVDSDFDGFYEEGFEYFSGSEVRFQYNLFPKGSSQSFKFVASQVTQLTFKHTFRNNNNTASFTGDIAITCFPKDSDGDTVPDASDGDSDNDGIPDLIEDSLNTIKLSGNDRDFDGLDDIFKGVGIIPADFDKDGVPDHLDLDSDNDGVYDFFEAGHTLSDSNLDGRIDNAASIVGLNGIANALETVPDNFILSFVLSDLDSDGILSSNDYDSDGDRCSDVIEAGYLDPDNDDLIGTSPVQVNNLGKVINIPDGYTVPHPNYSIIAPIDLNTPFVDITLCEFSTSSIFIDSTADVYQWQISTDGGVNWSNLNNNSVYNGVTTSSLQITNVLPTYEGHMFRVYMERTGNSCSTISNAITLSVAPLPVVNPKVDLKQCGDGAGFAIFNLNQVNRDISANYLNETFVFYPTLLDAEQNTNAITNPVRYTNVIPTTDKVWARAITIHGCYRISEVTLIVSTTGIPITFQRNFSVCDDYIDADNNDRDGISSFDFSAAEVDILSLFSPSQLPEVTYYRNEADALAEINPITDIRNYRNVGYPNSQRIYIRVESRLNNDCLGLGPHINLNVTPVPLANPVNNLEICDNNNDGDSNNGFVQSFDISSQTSLILGTQNPTDHLITYHESSADANSGMNPISNLSSYGNKVVNRQTIYVRMINVNTNCFTAHTTFDLVVNPLPKATPVTDLQVCDDDLDGSAQNGFSQNINLEQQTLKILGSQSPNDFTLTYHTSASDAQAGFSAIQGTFSNTSQNTQTIYVRIVNNRTGCVGEISNFNVVINPRPLALNISDVNYCDDDSDGNNTNGIIQSIDLQSQISGILGATQNPNDFTISFHESSADATSGDRAISFPYTNSTPHRQTIYVRIVNKQTNCANNTYSFDVVVNPLPIFTITSPQVLCQNTPRLTLSVENPVTTYDYVWTDPDGNTINGSNVTATKGGAYTVTATSITGAYCNNTKTIHVIESVIASFTENDVTIVDNSENNSIAINPSKLGLSQRDYEYALRNEQGTLVYSYQSNPLFENLRGGLYTILIRNKNGCGVSSLIVPVLEYPKFFTPNGDGDNDLWNIRGTNTTFFPKSKVNVYNRFGKRIASFDTTSQGWNGSFNGKVLPPDDYWFVVELVDQNKKVRTIKGHFSLIR